MEKYFKTLETIFGFAWNYDFSSELYSQTSKAIVQKVDEYIQDCKESLGDVKITCEGFDMFLISIHLKPLNLPTRVENYAIQKAKEKIFANMSQLSIFTNEVKELIKMRIPQSTMEKFYADVYKQTEQAVFMDLSEKFKDPVLAKFEEYKTYFEEKIALLREYGKYLDSYEISQKIFSVFAPITVMYVKSL